ncbi:MAG: toxin-activating lysine-acyltransferase [Pseudomonadota bacterium]
MTTPDNTINNKPPLDAAQMQQLADVAKAQAQRVMGKIPVLGAVAWLMMQQAGARHTLLSELDWRVMPPLVLEQAKLYMRDGAPIAYVSWAKLSDGAAQRYLEAPHHLTAADWKSGDQVWIIDLVAPFGGASEVMKELRETLFSGKAIHQLMPDAQGQAKTLTWPAVEASS